MGITHSLMVLMHKAAPHWPVPALHTANPNPCPPKSWISFSVSSRWKSALRAQEHTKNVSGILTGWRRQTHSTLCSLLNVLSGHRFPQTPPKWKESCQKDQSISRTKGNPSDTISAQTWSPICSPNQWIFITDWSNWASVTSQGFCLG